MKTKSTPTQTDMAKELGISTSYLNLLFAGKKPVSLKLAYRWSKVFPDKHFEWWLNVPHNQIEKFFVNYFESEYADSAIQKHSKKIEAK